MLEPQIELSYKKYLLNLALNREYRSQPHLGLGPSLVALRQVDFSFYFFLNDFFRKKGIRLEHVPNNYFKLVRAEYHNYLVYLDHLFKSTIFLKPTLSQNFLFKYFEMCFIIYKFPIAPRMKTEIYEPLCLNLVTLLFKAYLKINESSREEILHYCFNFRCFHELAPKLRARETTEEEYFYRSFNVLLEDFINEVKLEKNYHYYLLLLKCFNKTKTINIPDWDQINLGVMDDFEKLQSHQTKLNQAYRTYCAPGVDYDISPIISKWVSLDRNNQKHPIDQEDLDQLS